MEQGWVYVLVNSSIPGVSKVGRTTRPPCERAAELSSATGVAMPFVLAFEQAFGDCAAAERHVHAELDRRGWRVAANREFFRGSPSEIVRVVLEAAAVSGDGSEPPPSPRAEALLEEGDRHLWGSGEALQDVPEAVRCYRMAAGRGSLKALERLGMVYGRLGGERRAGRRRAMRCLKEGARRGNYYCFAQMAELFAADRHLQNFVKSWDLFFARRADSRREEVESEAELMLALRRYIGLSLTLGLVPGHLAELRAEADGLVRSLLGALDGLRDAPEDRAALAATLRWIYETLLPPPARAARAAGRWRRAWLGWPLSASG